MEREWYVYLLASQKDGVFYVGVTNNPGRRVWEHKNGKGGIFTRKYHVNRLVWLHGFPSPDEAISFEKRLKKWRRLKKIELIEEMNPDWNDLFDTIQS